MREYRLISDYKQNEVYKESFNELAKQTFGLDFKEWYDKGCWNDDYICYSFVDGDTIIANASINKMLLTSNGKEYKAIQVGTVMTHPEYRHQGLSAKLMNHILEKYETEYDFIYLFANETVLDFYPKFGFEKVHESSYTLAVSDLKKQVVQPALRKLDVDNPADFELMKEFAVERIPVSSAFGVKNNEHLLMVYFIVVFRDAIYYDHDEDAILLFEQKENTLHVYDIVSKRKVDLEKVVSHIISEKTEFVHFYFVPDSDNENIQSTLITETDDTLFVRPFALDEGKHFRFPLTSHA
ncbi:GNAT family N-acetyltransferase [Paenibacillus sp. MZ04-78.2]|uniref:GNAT family N-acetyltransferase n=1 Tax=Paenibacillus sp. MZ04-78.2 TaxID=2962034 RepID=UPI0020B7CE27|nr:GNAT family N-acetyltransferase [Paenibacillus sp. MZ04-78.2]MCP3773184.1 GNAT family N-acetyltransferase [Paenibacillus sp. MZ04-78.2]